MNSDDEIQMKEYLANNPNKRQAFAATNIRV
jgi:hypothetical protein